jgi:hypothetical protein
MATNFDLYHKAIAADDAFTAELTRVYGSRACEKRYQSAPYSDSQLEAASRAKRIADTNWITEMQKTAS